MRGGGLPVNTVIDSGVPRIPSEIIALRCGAICVPVKDRPVDRRRVPGFFGFLESGVPELISARSSEQQRLRAMRRYRVAGTDNIAEFDSLVRLAIVALSAPAAAISIVDDERVTIKAAAGAIALSSLPAEYALCNLAIRQNRPWIVEDALSDERTRNNPYVVGPPRLRFYAGAPLRTSDGYNIGMFAIVGSKPRTLAPVELKLLAHMAEVAMDVLEMRLMVLSQAQDISALAERQSVWKRGA
ncbi:GAF domain-containing protein [Stakelama tenebrarum]|uniref:GAF domain-containing protein n=1 Tax=Stakelama tenebrarum TaxID=2711215 RepID=A0A6G6Y766_9SPHN|nr:GAF domain-containing protein [Sphingosinithalassobacter tenebrarum]QIG80637.1 GAF domain-containing protein [Sphingosinithalassobacter tenebrarum]